MNSIFEWVRDNGTLLIVAGAVLRLLFAVWKRDKALDDAIQEIREMSDTRKDLVEENRTEHKEFRQAGAALDVRVTKIEQKLDL